MTARELKEDLRRKGIRYGICEENILHFFEGGGDRELVVAQGKPYRILPSYSTSPVDTSTFSSSSRFVTKTSFPTNVTCPFTLE